MNSKGRTINSIKGEIHNLLAVLRFLPSSCPETHTEELMDLFQKLLVCSDVDSVDFWAPFLKIIQGPDANSAIKGVALSSIHKFLLYGFLSPTSDYTLNKIVNGVVQCIIDTYSSSDEVVLMKLLQVFLECLRAPASIYLTDASVWSISKRCFDVYERDRVSELLKKTAQNTLLQIFLIVFGRVGVISQNSQTSGYGVVCLKKILLHLAHLIGYSDKSDVNFKEKRCLGLFLINTALETAGENIGLHQDLISVIQDEVCKSLLLNSATDDLFILSLTLRVVFNLFQSVKQHLKVQQEVFFNSLHLKIAAAYEETGDPIMFQRSELALESIVDFCREPTLILELYTNYDCDVEFANIFERLAKFLCKHAFPLNSSFNRLNELCLEGILAIITSISMRCDPNLQPSGEQMQDFREKKAMKEIFLKSAEIFNSDQKEFIPKLQELGYLPKDCDALAVAKFFKENPAIDHEKLGEYMGKKHDFNIKVLENFLGLFDYKSVSIDQAMRNIFKSCRIPGEAQVVDRVVTLFAHAYHKQNDIVKDENSAYVLAFSIMLLNTDLHNPSLKSKMSVESYIRNLQGVNGGDNFPEDYLRSLYESIKADPIEEKEVIRTIEHHEMGDMTSKWGKILLRSKNVDNYWMLNELLRQPAGENEKLMFDLLWESGLLGTLTSAIESASSPRAISDLRTLLVECSKVAAYFNMNDYILKLISILCQCFVKNTESVAQLYSTPRAFYILEAAVGSALVAKDNLYNAWGHLINCLLRLHKLKVLPSQLIELDDFVDEDGNALPMATTQLDETFFQYFRSSNYSQSASFISDEEPVEESSGIWASFVKYLGVPTLSNKTSEDILQEMISEVKEKIHTSGIHILFISSKNLELEGLTSYIANLLQKCKAETDEISIVLCLELITSTVLSNFSRLTDTLWKNILEVLENLICAETYTWTSERALVNLIRITVLHHEDYSGLRQSLQNVLKYMSQLNTGNFVRFGERLAAGLTILLSQGNAYFLYTADNWQTLLKLLQNFVLIDKTTRTGLEVFIALLPHLEKNSDIDLSMFDNLLDIVKMYFRSEHLDPPLVQKSTEIVMKILKSIQKRTESEIVCVFWKKIVGELGRLCQNNKHSIRVFSYTALQEAILNFTNFNTWAIWRECFDKVLFPLVIEPFVITKDMLKGVSEEKAQALRNEYEMSREKATSLVCQTVLNILPMVVGSSDLGGFWLRLVKLLAQTLKNKDEVNERSYELIKNLFLIMKNENAVSEELWKETWVLVNLEALQNEVNS